MGSCDKHVNNGKSTASYERENPRLCDWGCGFYGSAATNNLCSMCFKHYLKQLEASKSDIAAKPSQALHNTKNPIQRVDNTSVMLYRCVCCKKKVGVMGFSCRCGGTFCGIHRYPEEHACNFDFKTPQRDALAKQNPVCKKDKLEYRI